MALKAEDVYAASKKAIESVATGFKSAKKNADGTITVTFVDGSSVTTDPIKGDKGNKGDKGDKFEYSDFTPEELESLKGDKGDQGNRGVGIESITKESTSGLVDTYLILFADGTTTTFEVVNGANVTKTSQLDNDSEFITNATIGLINYYLKDEVYNKAKIDELLRNVGAGLSVKIVPQLPTEEISGTTIYLINTAGSNYNQYMYIDGDWASLGSTSVDLSSYYNKTQIDNMLLGYVSSSILLTQLLAYTKTADLAKVARTNSYNDLDDLPEIPDVSGIKPYVDVVQDSSNTAPTSKALYDAVQDLEGQIEEAGAIDDDAIAEKSTWSSKKINDSLVDLESMIEHLSDDDEYVLAQIEYIQTTDGAGYTSPISPKGNYLSISNCKGVLGGSIISPQYSIYGCSLVNVGDMWRVRVDTGIQTVTPLINTPNVKIRLLVYIKKSELI